MEITVEPPVADYFILELAVTDEMIAKDPWGREWFSEIDQWCNDSFGEQDVWGQNPVSGWKRMRHKYFFTKEDMCSMFMIRWRY
jgi:hypothetical protein